MTASVTAQADDTQAPPPAPTESELAEAWFDAPPSSRRPTSAPPVSVVGEFLGDPLADAWLR